MKSALYIFVILAIGYVLGLKFPALGRQFGL